MIGSLQTPTYQRRQTRRSTPNVVRGLPTLATLERVTIAHHAEFELSDAEMRRLRVLIYGINKDGIRRYRTMREGPYLMVWRLK